MTRSFNNYTLTIQHRSMIKNGFFLFFVIFGINLNNLGAQKNLVKTTLTAPTSCDLGYYQLVFTDEFESQTLDTNVWYTYYPYGNNTTKDSCGFCRTHASANVYLDENCVLKDGKLHLLTKEQPIRWFERDFRYTSGMVHSKQVFTRYAKYEIRCKLPKGKQHWPAFWVFGWNTEIDIFEFSCKGTSKLEFSVHNWLSKACDNDNPKKNKPCYSNRSKLVDFGTDFSDDYHIFSMEYEPHLIKFYIDNVMVRVVPKYYTLKKKPIYHCSLPPGEYYIDPAFPNPGEPVQVIANNFVCWEHKEKNPVFPNIMEIDYIRVFQKTIQEGLVVKQLP